MDEGEQIDFEIENGFDFYDYGAIEKLHERMSKQYLKIAMNLRKAEEKGDAKALERAKKAYAKHKRRNAMIKRKAQVTGYFWY
jgi:hypothetical protein